MACGSFVLWEIFTFFQFAEQEYQKHSKNTQDRTEDNSVRTECQADRMRSFLQRNGKERIEYHLCFS